MNEVLNNKKRSEILAEEIKKMNYGDILSHELISNIIKVEYPSNAYRTTISKTKNLLKEHGYFLESIIGDGYRIVEPDNVVNHSLKHYKRGFNELGKGYETLRNAPAKHMSKEGLEVYRRISDRAVTLNAAMKGASVELKTLSKKNHPFALENIKN